MLIEIDLRMEFSLIIIVTSYESRARSRAIKVIIGVSRSRIGTIILIGGISGLSRPRGRSMEVV